MFNLDVHTVSLYEGGEIDMEVYSAKYHRIWDKNDCGLCGYEAEYLDNLEMNLL